MPTPLLQGFSLGASLIIAIGSQNAYVLRQGLRKEYVFTVCTICFTCDVILIVLGVAGFGTLIGSSTALMLFARWGGALFLFLYGAKSFLSAFKTQVLLVDTSDKPATDFQWAVATTLALTLLNPHVYMDTVVLLGSIAGQLPEYERAAFAIGASLASLVWFYALGYGARILTPLFNRPAAWKFLDVLIGCIMWTIAWNLVRTV